MERYHLSAAEREVMEKLWEHSEPIRQSMLLEEFRQGGKNWARQTLNTVLHRLEVKTLVERENHMVWARLTQEQLGLEIALDAISTYYDGKVNRFLVAFAEAADISEEEKRFLRDYIERKDRKEG